MSFKQELVGVMGTPVADNPSQAMMEAAFRAAGLDWRYMTLEVMPQDLGTAVKGARAMGMHGFNCTMPHKITVMEHLDEIGESASRIGAVNCVVRKGDRFIGENTDGRGFTEALKRRVEVTGRSVAILGSGGAARAIAVELALAGASHITVIARNTTTGPDLVATLGKHTEAEALFQEWVGDAHIPAGVDIVVNGTPIGLFPDVDARIPLDVETLEKGMIVADVVFNPVETHLLLDAQQRGCDIIDGLEMLVGQGAIGFRYWTDGGEPDEPIMRDCLSEIFATGY